MSRRSDLGAKLKALRKGRSWTLAEVSERTSVPISSLSKIENNQLSPTYDQLLKISDGLGIDIAELLAADREPGVPSLSGRRSINRLGDGTVIDGPNQHLHYLSTDLLDKEVTPIYATVKARSIDEYDELMRHPGEEFLYVLEGAVELHTEFYAPVILETGESIYFDSSMGHAYVAIGDSPCRILSVCSAPHNKVELAKAVANAKLRKRQKIKEPS